MTTKKNKKLTIRRRELLRMDINKYTILTTIYPYKINEEAFLLSSSFILTRSTIFITIKWLGFPSVCVPHTIYDVMGNYKNYFKNRKLVASLWWKYYLPLYCLVVTWTKSRKINKLRHTSVLLSPSSSGIISKLKQGAPVCAYVIKV